MCNDGTLARKREKKNGTLAIMGNLGPRIASTKCL